MYHSTKGNFLSSSSDEIISKENDAQLVRVINDPHIDVHRGLYADKFSTHVFGASDGIPGTPIERDVWEYGDTNTGDQNYNWLTTASTLRVRAGNAADMLSGIGARTTRITGLDSSWQAAEETILMSGINASLPTTTEFIRVNKVRVVTVGLYTGANIGPIIVEDTNTSNVVGYVAAGAGHSQQTMYTTASGMTGYIEHAHGDVSATSNKEASLILYERHDAHITSGDMGGKHIIHKWEDLDSGVELKFFAPPTLTPMTDVWWTSVGVASSKVSVAYDVYCIEDDHGVSPQ